MAHPPEIELDSNKIHNLRKEWEEAKRKREWANMHRKEAHASMKAAQEADSKDVCQLELRLKKARRCHVNAVKDERRIFQELNACALENTKDNRRGSNETTSPHRKQDDTHVEVQTQRKRKRTSDQYLKYKERDDVFREWLSSVSSIDLDPVDNLLIAVEAIHDNIRSHCFDAEIPDFVVRNLEKIIELRQSEAERLNYSDEGHAYYVSVLQRCSKCLRVCRELTRETKESNAADDEYEHAPKRRRLAK